MSASNGGRSLAVAKRRSQISGYDGHDAEYGPFPTMPVFTICAGAVDSRPAAAPRGSGRGSGHGSTSTGAGQDVSHRFRNSDRFGSPAVSYWLPAGNVDRATDRVRGTLSRLRCATSPVQRAIRASQGRGSGHFGGQARG